MAALAVVAGVATHLAAQWYAAICQILTLRPLDTSSWLLAACMIYESNEKSSDSINR